MPAKILFVLPLMFGPIVLLTASAAPPPSAGARSTVDAIGTVLVNDLKGWPVIGDGGEIGVVADVIINADGEIEKVRARISLPLGFGERVVDIPAEIVSLTRDAVVLHVSNDELAAVSASLPATGTE